MPPSTKYVLITGTNGGLGLGICTRLLDDFLRTNNSSSSLTLIFTTRSTRKGVETLQTLKSHLSKHPPESQHRIHLQPESVELTNLLSIRTLSQTLLASNIPYLNAIILNAGIGGWSGLDWGVAIVDVLRDIATNTTWPRFKLGIAGLITDPQRPTEPPTNEDEDDTEPVLGQVFCANVFGHYMLTHWLMPLLRTCESTDPGRIIWVSSIEPMSRHFQETDLMGLRTTASYESSKRLTDILALTAGTASARTAFDGFVGVDDSNKRGARGGEKRETLSTPTMHVAQPGICTTSIVALWWIVHQFYILSIYMARWVGSPWATVSPYLAAMAFTWLALAPGEEVEAKGREYGEGTKSGRVKWGTAVTRSGQPSIRATEVDLWGINGSGESFSGTWWAGRWGRAPAARDATGEDVEEFVAMGARVWREMEKMRKEWEGLINGFDGKEKERGA